MLRSMYSGISGMKNFQTKLDVIGNNIANVNTYGFKKGRVTFKDTMNQMISGATAATENRGGKNPTQIGLGSTLATIDTIHTGSSLQTTGRALDLGIDGDGYFVVRQGDAMMYTRAGNFYLDDNGTLVNADGLKVQAFSFDDRGNLTNEYGNVVVNVNAVLPGIETTAIKFSENLSANAIVGSIFSQQVKVVDTEGRAIPTTVYFKKLDDDQWGVYVNEVPKPSEAVATPVGNAGKITITNPEKYTGNTDEEWTLEYRDPDPDVSGDEGFYLSKDGINFIALTENDGILSGAGLDGLNIDISKLSPNAGDTWNIHIKAEIQPIHILNFVNGEIPTNNVIVPLNITVPTGRVDDPNTQLDESVQMLNGIQFDFSSLTQLGGATTAVVDPNGNSEGKLESFNIDSLGVINGVYSNGEIITLGQLAIAKFSNTSGLTKAGNNLFQESINSGTPDINVAGEGRGTLASGSLEMSNVDLSEEFTEMITAQRGFQANSRIITTSDEILQELVNLKR